MQIGGLSNCFLNRKFYYITFVGLKNFFLIAILKLYALNNPYRK